MAAKKRRSTKKVKGRTKPAARVEFNHAMIYTTRLDESLAFYRDALGFQVVDSYPGAYARLKGRGRRTTIALHVPDPGQQVNTATEGVRLYFEVSGLARFCKALLKKGVHFDQMPQRMPWGWTHAYLRDPDGHEISLYYAGAARFKKTAMK